MARLGVNIDHIATLRQARGGSEPDPVVAAILAEQAGADGIVLHLREDRRHVQDRDLRLLRQIVTTKLDLEMAPVDEMVKIALDVRPDLVTLVPERREEKTTEGGLDALALRDRIQEVTALLHDGGIVISLFIEPDLEIVKVAHKIGADYVELHTGHYANAKRAGEETAAIDALQQSARFAAKLGLGVNAGHGLNYRNAKRLAAIKEIVEFNIGHSIVSRAVQVGIERAVREMKELVR
ncbi:MAG: pyridoxine 5'-phosphate synthase [Nitrospirota bacterium]